MGSWVYKRDTFSVKNGFLKGGKGSDLGVQSPRKLNSVKYPPGCCCLVEGRFWFIQSFQGRNLFSFFTFKDIAQGCLI